MAIKALNNQMNRIVRVNRAKLVETLKKNRVSHIQQHGKAMAGYKDAAVTNINEAFNGLAGRLDKRKAELLESVSAFTPETASSFADHLTILNSVVVNLKVPVDYTAAYDAAIDMAEFDTREELELSGAEFQCFCRDVWEWSEEFRTTSTMYAR